MLSQILIGLLGMGIGFLILWQSRNIVRIVGTVPSAERIFGGAGTYLLIRLIGAICMIYFFLTVFGWVEPVRNFISNSFFGFLRQGT